LGFLKVLGQFSKNACVWAFDPYRPSGSQDTGENFRLDPSRSSGIDGFVNGLAAGSIIA
jgi:hypothetical protein